MSDQLFWFAARGAGIVSLVLSTAVVYLGILSVLRWKTKAWPPLATAGLHRNLALLSVVFLAIHIVTAVVDPYVNLGWLAALLPFSSGYRTLWLGLGVVAFDLGVALVLTSLFRSRVGMRTWRAVHWLSYAAWPMAVAHSVGTGTDATTIGMRALTATCIFVVTAAAAVRLAHGRPEPVRRRPEARLGR